MGMVTTRSASTPASRYIRRTNSLGTHSSSTSTCSGVSHSCGIAPNSQGWMIASRPARAGLRSGGHWWRTSTSAVWTSGGDARLVAVATDPLDRAAQAVRDTIVDDRQAGRQAVVALPAHGDVLGRGLSVHPGRDGRRRSRPRARRRRRRTARGSEIPACSCSSSPGSSASRSSVRARSSTSRPSKVRPSTRRGWPRAGRRGAGRAPGSAPPGTRRRPAARSPTTSTAAPTASTPREQSADLGRREGAAQLDVAAAIERLELLGEAVGHLAEDLDVQPRLGPLRRLDEQLRALVRVGRAQEGDGEVLRRRARAGGRGPPAPRSRRRGASPGAPCR